MTTIDFVTALFYEVDEQMRAIPKHPEAHLWPSEVVTLGLLHALKGAGNRAFYRWLTRDYRALFPRLPERTRLFRLFVTHQDWTQVFLAAPTVLGGIDTYGIELNHPMRGCDRATPKQRCCLLPASRTLRPIPLGCGHRFRSQVGYYCPTPARIKLAANLSG